MPSKKRGGLSKPEYARAQAAKAKAAPKPSTRSVASKSVAPLVGAGPLMTGQTRVGSTVQGAGPLLPGQTRDNSYSGGSSRSMAAKAQKSKNTGLSGGAGLTFGSSGGGTKTDLSAPGLSYSSKGISSGPNQNFSPAPSTNGFKGFLNKYLGEGSLLGDFGDAGLVQGNAGRLAGLVKGSTPSAFASEGDQNFPGQEMNYTPLLQGDGSGRITDSVPSEQLFTPKNQPFSSVSDTASTASSRYNDLFGGDNGSNNSGRSRGNIDPGTQESIDYSQQQNDLYGNNEQAPFDQAPRKVTTQVRGSGLFGTGKGVGNPAGEDPYIKELRKAYSSNGGEKWLRKQFEELISALDPTYAQLQKEGTDALNAQLNNSSNQLASVMNANNTGDSEQRAQMLSGLQRDNSTALGNLLAKLAQNKAQDVSGYKSQEAEAMSKFQQNKQQDARTLLEKLQAYRSQQGTGQGRASSPVTPKAPSHNEVFNWVEDALGKGYSWQEIADNAVQQGIGTETGSYLDQLLNNANKQNRFAR